MGVTTGGLLKGEHQIITITIPSAPDQLLADKLAGDLQAIIDAFNQNHPDGKLEVL
jgi:hypothetical protein